MNDDNDDDDTKPREKTSETLWSQAVPLDPRVRH